LLVCPFFARSGTTREDVEAVPGIKLGIDNEQEGAVDEV
jgi:hypothetical protein